MTTINAHDYTVGEILTAATMDGVTSDLNTLLAEVEGSCYIETGTYTGDGTTGQTITLADAELVINHITIWTGAADTATCITVATSDLYVDDDAQGLAAKVGDQVAVDDAIKSIGTGSFVVSDQGTDAYPNGNGTTFYYSVWGTH